LWLTNTQLTLIASSNSLPLALFAENTLDVKDGSRAVLQSFIEKLDDQLFYKHTINHFSLLQLQAVMQLPFRCYLVNNHFYHDMSIERHKETDTSVLGNLYGRICNQLLFWIKEKINSEIVERKIEKSTSRTDTEADNYDFKFYDLKNINTPQDTTMISSSSHATKTVSKNIDTSPLICSTEAVTTSLGAGAVAAAESTLEDTAILNFECLYMESIAIGLEKNKTWKNIPYNKLSEDWEPKQLWPLVEQILAGNKLIDIATNGYIALDLNSGCGVMSMFMFCNTLCYRTIGFESNLNAFKNCKLNQKECLKLKNQFSNSWMNIRFYKNATENEQSELQSVVDIIGNNPNSIHLVQFLSKNWSIKQRHSVLLYLNKCCSLKHIITDLTVQEIEKYYKGELLKTFMIYYYS
jgi:hypothetical protein